MPTYEIEQYEIHVQTYEVDADNEAEAIAKLFKGDAEPIDDSLEYIEIADDYGLPAEEHRELAEEHRELAEELRSLGVSMDEHVIPSIRSIVRIK
jgi:hypothetical protein